MVLPLRIDLTSVPVSAMPASISILDRIVEPRLAVFRDDLDRALVLLGHVTKPLGVVFI